MDDEHPGEFTFLGLFSRLPKPWFQGNYLPILHLYAPHTSVRVRGHHVIDGDPHPSPIDGPIAAGKEGLHRGLGVSALTARVQAAISRTLKPSASLSTTGRLGR